MFRIYRRRAGCRQSGYMLLVLMLAVAMLMITLMGVATNYRQSIRRDREVEMIHRGVQYERAVRLYYRKNNSYPPSIDRLLETNKVRYLRKRYKDPMTQDGAWKIAHLTDINLPTSNTGLGASSTSSANSAGPGGSTTGTPTSQPGGATGSSTDTSAPGTPIAGNATPGGATGATPGGTASGTTGAAQAAAGTADQGQAASANTGPANTFGGTGEALGGGAMIGVVSKSTQEGVHSFNEKTKYNEWLFIYLPTQDVTNQPGHIPNGPFNPKASTTGVAAGQSGVTPGPTQGTGMQGVPTITPMAPATPPAPTNQ